MPFPVSLSKKTIHFVYRTLFLTGLGLLFAGCYLDELTAPSADESAIEFDVSGDSVLLRV